MLYQSKHFGFNYYKYDLINKINSLINTKVLESLKNQGSVIYNEIKWESCLFMKNLGIDKDIISCFFGVGFPD